MESGSIASWNLKEGDSFAAGDVMCSVETDKATVGFEVQEKGFIAQAKESSDAIPVGEPVVVVVKKKDFVKDFENYAFDGAAPK